MAELPAHSDAADDPDTSLDSEMSSVPRWVMIAGIAIIGIIVVVFGALHLFGVVGPLAEN